METFLDASVEEVPLQEYELVARRDRDDGRKCGGVAVFAQMDQAAMESSLESKLHHEMATEVAAWIAQTSAP